MAPTLRPPGKISTDPIRSAFKQPRTETPPPRPPTISPPVCFSFAAYARTIIQHLRYLNVDVSPGLTDDEISAVESSLSVSFPPDLRSILQSGLPVGTHFPDWRFGSTQQLLVLLNLPALHLSKNVVRNGFWVGSWGPRPKNDVVALSLVKKLLEHAPVLVPIYRNCYVPSTTRNLAGNPVFQIDANGVRVFSFDVAGFFERFDSFSRTGDFNAGGFTSLICCDRRTSEGTRIPPAWVATEARRVEFWTDVAEKGRRMTARGPTRGWWSALGDEGLCMGLRACLDDAFWKLRDGGWNENDVREMMNDREASSGGPHEFSTVDDALQQVNRRITALAQTLSRAGWSREDVVYSLDLGEDHESDGCDSDEAGDGIVVHPDYSTELRHQSPASCWMEDEDLQRCGEMTTLMYLLSLEA